MNISNLNTRFMQRVVNVAFLLLVAGLLTAGVSGTTLFHASDGSDGMYGTQYPTSRVGTDPFVGEIAVFPYNFAPRGWAACNGQLLPISQNQALFSLLGTMYGGDGRTTFALPDLRGRVVVHNGTGPGLSNYRIGAKGGAESHTLNLAQLPAHSHNAAAKQGTAMAPASSGGGRAGGLTKPTAMNASSGAAFSAQSAGGDVTLSVESAGNGQAVNHMQPYLTVGYYIALQGVFPSRN